VVFVATGFAIGYAMEQVTGFVIEQATRVRERLREREREL
jgi:HAMP domain-containing protein